MEVSLHRLRIRWKVLKRKGYLCREFFYILLTFTLINSKIKKGFIEI